MRNFDSLSEREILALAISLEEEDERIYADFAEGLRQDFPASAAVFDGMQAEESSHRRRLIELFREKFGDHIPLLRRHDVRGFVNRRPVWLVRPLGLETVRNQASAMEVETRRFYEKAAARAQDARLRQLLDDLAQEERTHAAFATHNSWDAFVVGLAASIGAGISMGFAEALSDDGSLTGRGHPWVRGFICGLMTALGGIGHTLPFLLSDFRVAMTVAVLVVVIELGIISWVRHRYMETPAFSAALQVGLGGILVFVTGVLIGSA